MTTHLLNLLLMPSIVTAPPPQAGTTSERITFWAGDTLVHMRPDGSDVTTVAVSKGLSLPRFGELLPSQDFQSVTFRDTAPGKKGAGESETLLTIATISAEGEVKQLKGYVPAKLFPCADGRFVVFDGLQVTEGRRSKGNWILDQSNMSVKKLPFPEGTSIVVASSNGKHFLTRNGASRKIALVSADGKNTREVFSEVEATSVFAISSDGKHAIAAKDRNIFLADMTTNKQTPLRNLPVAGGLPRAFCWNPEGTKIAYDWVKGAPMRPNIPVPAGAIAVLPYFEHKVFVADPDGSNAKEIYSVVEPNLRAFSWR